MSARGVACVLLTGLSGCPMPEELYVLSGQVLDSEGVPAAEVEVRLLRNQVASDTRCDSLEALDTTRTDSTGHYRFSLLRQQVNRGVPGQRFFRAEVDGAGHVFSQSFWFPNADLDLGVLQKELVPSDAYEMLETRIDGRLAWRDFLKGRPEGRFDLPHDTRRVDALREWRSVPIDSLGRFEVIPVEWRREAPWTRGDSDVPRVRDIACPDIDVSPCPLTDGRYIPYVLAPNTRAIVLHLTKERHLRSVDFSGVVLERAAARLLIEFNDQPTTGDWNAFESVLLSSATQKISPDSCNEPGAFMTVLASRSLTPAMVRLVFIDERGESVPILSLSEVALR